MAGGKSTWFADAVMDGALGGPVMTLPTNVYIALSTAAFDPAAADATVINELSGSGYARVATTNDQTAWPLSSSNGNQKINGVTFTFPAALADWPQIASFYICDAATSGHWLYGGDLTTPRTLAQGDTASFGPGSIVITEK